MIEEICDEKICIKPTKSLFLTIATIVLALLLIIQILITAWLYPRPWQFLSEHPYLSDWEVREAADALEREFVWKSLRYRDLLLNISYTSEEWMDNVYNIYLEEHPGVAPANVIVFSCYIYYRDTGGTTPVYVVMEKDAKGNWYCAEIGG